ncbi:hypothetical protein ACFL4G_03950 [Thermodesulfobacteriota bacterium]
MEKGIGLLIVGVLGLIGVYSIRPPSGFGEALLMVGQGKDFYLKEPLYLILMAISGLITVFGLILTVKGLDKTKDQ